MVAQCFLAITASKWRPSDITKLLHYLFVMLFQACTIASYNCCLFCFLSLSCWKKFLPIRLDPFLCKLIDEMLLLTSDFIVLLPSSGTSIKISYAQCLWLQWLCNAMAVIFSSSFRIFKNGLPFSLRQFSALHVGSSFLTTNAVF